jgi:hypothetical protein
VVIGTHMPRRRDATCTGDRVVVGEKSGRLRARTTLAVSSALTVIDVDESYNSDGTPPAEPIRQNI